mmetsp:Transcript_54255/g.107748  ORF Transcript_54255/g.107748 Transcript_54255/m.107748 type:complete len:203 (+) Transcript_54255:2781-3389(+)
MEEVDCVEQDTDGRGHPVWEVGHVDHECPRHKTKNGCLIQVEVNDVYERPHVDDQCLKEEVRILDVALIMGVGYAEDAWEYRKDKRLGLEDGEGEEDREDVVRGEHGEGECKGAKIIKRVRLSDIHGECPGDQTARDDDVGPESNNLQRGRQVGAKVGGEGDLLHPIYRVGTLSGRLGEAAIVERDPNIISKDVDEDDIEDR